MTDFSRDDFNAGHNVLKNSFVHFLADLLLFVLLFVDVQEINQKLDCTALKDKKRQIVQLFIWNIQNSRQIVSPGRK